MTSAEQALLLLILLVGAILVLAILVKADLECVGLPALVGYIALGLLLRMADQRWQLFAAGEQEVLEFLADIDIISLLFRVGLESKLDELIRQLRRASYECNRQIEHMQNTELAMAAVIKPLDSAGK